MINMTMDQAQKALKVKDAVLRLFKDEDYKLVFEESYFKDEAMRLTLAIVDNEMQDEIDQRLINEQTRGIGHLHVFLNTRIALGNQVEQSLAQEEKERVDATKSVEYDEITGDLIVEEEV